MCRKRLGYTPDIPRRPKIMRHVTTSAVKAPGLCERTRSLDVFFNDRRTHVSLPLAQCPTTETPLWRTYPRSEARPA